MGLPVKRHMSKPSNKKLIEQINAICTRGVARVIKEESVKKKLLSGKSLRIKHGIDPTTADLHLGYYVVYRKLKKLQDLGHTIVFLIGDFTAQFGDPTGKMNSRDERSSKEIRVLATQLIKQLGAILDISKTEIRYNSQWYEKMSGDDFVRLLQRFSVWRLLERDLFQERRSLGKELRVSEFIYPILQAYDSVQLKSDLTVIGSDQIFNELQARSIQEHYGQPPQDLIATDLLVGTDGKQKMSQSLNNYISLQDKPAEQFGKIMSIPDTLIAHYSELLTDVPIGEIEKMSELISEKKVNPRDTKLELAYKIVEELHGSKKAFEAKEQFIAIFQKKELPKDIKTLNVEKGTLLRNIIYDAGFSQSLTGADRLIKQGAVSIDNSVIKEWNYEVHIKESSVLRVGRRQFIKLVPRKN